MELPDDLLGLVYEAHQLLARLENTPRDYGTGDQLFSSEIHTIEAIGNRPDCNLAAVADELGVSSPAAHKSVRRLVASGYVHKSKSPHNRRDLVLTLTDRGRRAYAAHQDFARRMFAPLTALELHLGDTELETIRRYLRSLVESCPWRQK